MFITDGSTPMRPPPPPRPLAKPETVTQNACVMAKPEPPPPMKPDVMKAGEPHHELLPALGRWSASEWTSLAGLGHGFTSVPGIVSHSFKDAAKTNEMLLKGVRDLANDWPDKTPAARQSGIDALERTAAGKSAAVRQFTAELTAENTLPRLVYSVGAPVDRLVSSIGNALSSRVGTALDALPARIQIPMRGIVNRFQGRIAGAYDGLKSSITEPLNRLSPALEGKAGALTGSLDTAIEADQARAGGVVRSASRVIGATPGEAAQYVHLDGAASALEKVPLLRDTPVVGLALAATGSVLDAGKVGAPDSIVANFGSTVAGSAIGSVAADAAPSLLAAAGIGDTGAELLGLAAATGPAGLAVAGGVVIGAAATYGIYKAIESKPGQEIVNGAAHGVEAVGRGTVEVAKGAYHDGESIVNGVGSFLGL
jgi:hypothetical protein